MKKQTNSTGWECPTLSRYFMSFLLLLIGLIGGAGSAWAEEVTIFDAAASEWASATLASGATTVGSVTWYGGGSAAIDNGGTVDGRSWSNRLKFGGASTFQTGTTLSRVLSFSVSSAGTVKVYAVTGKSEEDRYVYVSQSMTPTNRDESTAIVKQNTNPASVAVATVEAGMVYVWAGNNIGIYGITFEPSTTDVTLVGANVSEDKSPLTGVEYGIEQSYTGGNYVLAGGMTGSSGKRYVSFTVPSGYTATVDAKAQNGAERILALGQARNVIQAQSYIWQTIPGTNEETSATSTKTLEPGTYYIGSTNSGLTLTSVIVHVTKSAETYTVTYDMNGHGDQIAQVASTTALPNPLPTPTAAGWEFVGWYTDNGLTTPAVAGAAISENTNLYAKWIAEVVSVTDWDQTYSNQTNGKKGFTTAPVIPEGSGTKLTFQPDVRYSKWVINSRINKYGESTNSNNHGFGVFTYAGAQTAAPQNPKGNIHYVPGFVAQGILEAIDYYRDADGGAGEIDVRPWFYAVQNWGITYDMSSGTKKGDELDGMSAVKLYSLLRKFAINGTFPDGTKNTNAATKTAANQRFSDALKALGVYNTTRVITSTTNAKAAGGWWHKSTYANQMWCDGQYMGPATLAHIINDCGTYSQIASTGTDWDLITKQIDISWNYLWDSNNKLLYHGFSAVPGTTGNQWATVDCSYDGNCKTNTTYWGRANGWYVLALVDILQQMERAGQGSTANFTNLKGKLNTLVAGIVARQDATTGCWYQVLDENTNSHTGNFIESSASALYLTSIMRAQRLGYLTTNYTSQIKKGYAGFVNNFLANDGNGGINVLSCSMSASLKDDKPGDANYYITGSDAKATYEYTEGKALGAFIMAAVEYERLYLEEPTYTVTYNVKDGGKCSLDSDTQSEPGVALRLPGVTPKKDKTFLGWSTNPEATVADEYLYAGWNYTPTSNVTLYAVYRSTNKIGDEHANWWQAFSDFVQLDVNKYKGFTFTNNGGNATHNNWVLIATNNNNGHAGDGVQTDGTNELFVLRADNYSWGTKNGEVELYKKVGENYNRITLSGDEGADFIAAMKNATVKLDATRIGKRVYVYVTTECTNGAKYVEKYTSGEINEGENVYLSFSTENSSITITEMPVGNAYQVKADTNGNGSVDVLSKEGISVNGFGLKEGATAKFVATPNEGYQFEKWQKEDYSDASTDNPYNTVVGSSSDRSVKANFIQSEVPLPEYTVGFNNAATQSTPNYFAISTSSYNDKYSGNYNGKEYTKGLKIESSTTISFTTTKPAIITIVQSTETNSDKTIRLDGNDLTGGVAEGTTAKVYTIKKNAGEHVISRGSGESGILYVSVQYLNGYTVTYNLNEHGDAIEGLNDVVYLPETLPTPSAEGYNFEGWFTDEEFNNAAQTGAEINVDVTLYAKWAQKIARAYSYTVRAVKTKGGALLKEIATGTYYEGDPELSVAIPQYVWNESEQTLYGVKTQTSEEWYNVRFTPDQDGYVYEVVYNNETISDIVYYTEGENIEGFGSATNIQRASNGHMGFSDSPKATVTLPSGNYQIFIRGVNGNAATRTVTFSDGPNTIATLSIPRNVNVLDHSVPFHLSETKTIYVTCEGSSISGLDWFYIQGTYALNVTENNQKYYFTQENVERDKYATQNSVNVGSEQDRDGHVGKYYNIKNPTNYVEIKELNATAFHVNAFHNNTKETRTATIYLDGEKVGTVSVAPGVVGSSAIFPITTGVTNVHTITVKGDGSDIFVSSVVFYNEKTAPTVSPNTISVMATKTKEFAITPSEGCTVTSMEPVSSQYADVTYDNGNGTLNVTGKKVGSVTVTFNIDAGSSPVFESGTASVTINVTKANLYMKYSPDSYTHNDRNSSPSLPSYELKYYVIDGDTVEITPAPELTMTYVTNDSKVAKVSNTGVITLADAANGEAAIKATSAENDVYTSASTSFVVNIINGYNYKVTESKGDAGPAIREGFVVKGSDETPLVYGKFGGWNRNSSKFNYADAETGKMVNQTDAWKAIDSYNNAIDDYKFYTSGTNDAKDEDMIGSGAAIYGVKRNGWFESPLKWNDDEYDIVAEPAPFSLPVRGTYMTFEPVVNGTLTIYILQNGAWNSAKDDVYDNDGNKISQSTDGTATKFPGMVPFQFRPHAFHVVDQNGMPIDFYTEFKVNTKQPITMGIYTQKQYDDLKSKMDKESDASKKAEMQRQLEVLDNFCANYNVKLGDKFKCIIDSSEDGYYDATNIGNWREFKEYMSLEEQQRVRDAWNTGVNGAQQVVKLDNGSFLAVDECIMKYTFYVAAGQTYYLFSNFSKMGFSGCNFVPDETEGSQPTATLALNETTKYVAPELDSSVGSGSNHVNNISVPQYRDVTISFSQAYSKGSWNTICLPFTVTEKETAEIFGTESDGLELLIMSGFEVEGTKATISFVYHEIQNILAGYPYLIKSGKNDVTSFTVHNKLIDPTTELRTYSFNGYKFKGVDGFCTPLENKPQYSKLLKSGDLFLSGNKFWQSAGSSYLRGYRAYIDSPSSPGAKNLTAITLSFGSADNSSNTTTSIEFVDVTPDASEVFDYVMPKNGVYNMSGQKVAGTVVGLPSGLYIVNGKKIVIK